MSRQYSRVFISLKQDRAGYAYKGKEPSGRCVIEAGSGIGKLTVYIQDIKPEVMYKAYIVNSNHNMSEGVQIGTLIVDVKGKAELKWEFDADNVGGTGKPIEDYNVFAVMIPAKNELITPLIGYKDATVAWKSNFVVFTNEAKDLPGANKTAVSPATADTDKAVGGHDTEDAVQTADDPYTVRDVKEEIEVFDKEEAPEAEVVSEAEDVASEEAVIASEEAVIASEEAVIASEEAAAQEAHEEEPAVEIPAEEIRGGEDIPAEDASADMSSVVVEENKFPSPNDFFETYVTEKEEHSAPADIISEEKELPPEDRDFSVDTETKIQEEPEEATGREQIFDGQDIHTTFMEMAKNFNKELKELEQITFVNPEDIKSAGAVSSDEPSGPAEDKPNETGVCPASDGIDEMFKNNPPMRPFHKQNIDVSWVRISIREIIFLPIDHWKYMNHSFIVSAYNRFRHLILGRYDENGECRYFLGVPEIYESSYKKSAMGLGFTQFKCCEDIRATSGEYGYWIMPIQQ